MRHSGLVAAAAFDPSGRLLLSAGEDRTVRVWDLATTEPVYTPLPHDSHVIKGGFSQDGKTIFTSAGVIDAAYSRAWNTEAGSPVTPPLRHAKAVLDSTLSDDGHLLATAGEDRTARIWRVGDGEPFVPPLAHDGGVYKVDFDHDGRRLLTVDNVPFFYGTGNGPAHAHVWDVATGTQVLTPLTHERALFEAVFTPDGRYIVTAGEDQARIWDATTGSPISPRLPCGSEPRMAMSSVGDRFAVASAGDNALRVWALPRGDLLALARQQTPTYGLRFSPDGARLATGGADGVAQVWNGGTVERIGPPMRHRGLIQTTQFDARGRWLLTSSTDYTARVWDAESGEPVTPPFRHASGVYSATFSPDGRRLLTTSADHTARVWDFVPDARPVEDLEQFARLFSSGGIVGASSIVNLTTEQLAEAWRVLCRRYPDAFEASPRQIRAWHQAKAEALLGEGRWRDSLVHLDRALGLGPPTWALLVNRGRAHAELNDWQDAAADYSAALGAIPGELEVVSCAESRLPARRQV
jgi:WD40 repeat protein